MYQSENVDDALLKPILNYTFRKPIFDHLMQWRETIQFKVVYL